MTKQGLRAVLISLSSIALAIILTGLCQPLKAQLGTSSLNGTVSDPSGAAVPGAEVSLESMTRMYSRKTVTNESGAYELTMLEPGTYQLILTAKGFATKTTQNILLASGQGSTLNVTLEVGAAVTHVTVTQQAALLDTTTATVGSRVESNQLTSLPLLGRNFTDLLLLLPGASPPGLTYFRSLSPAGGGNGGDVGYYGQRPRNNQFLLDGLPNVELDFSAVTLYPPPEAIAEMKVESGMDSGAYGWASGANINVVTKSGSNNYHGGLWEYVRNDVFNARDFFSPDVASLRWNQFGFSGGGPLAIPHVVSKGKNWYIYGWYEGIRKPNWATSYSLVPTDAELNGDFSADPPIYNPYTSIVSPTGVLTSRSQFANNQFPTGPTDVCSPNPTCFDPGALAIAKALYPAANLPTGSGPGGTNYVGVAGSVETYDQWSTRVDHQFRQNDNLSVRYSDARDNTTQFTLPTMPSLTHYRFTNVAVSETHTFNPTFLLTARFGWSRTGWTINTTGPAVAEAAGTQAAFPLVYQDLKRIPELDISGYIPLAQNWAYYGPEKLLMGTVDGQKMVGRHTIGFGGWLGYNTFQLEDVSNYESFSATPTQGLTPGTGSGLASFLLGLPSSSSRVVPGNKGFMHGKFYALYVQDGFRATPKLTVNVGVRYDVALPLTNSFGDGTFVWETGKYVFDTRNPITNEAPNTSKGLVPPDYNNFAPRVGLAYQINPQTTVRASYGIFYDAIGENPQSQQSVRGNWPYTSPQSVGSMNTGLPQYYLENPFPGPAVGSPVPLGCSQCLEVDKDTSRTPYVQEWTLSVQRQLTPALMFQTAYFGSHGLKQTGQILDNTAVVPGLGNYQDRQRWPDFPPYVNNGFNVFPSWYHGLSVMLRKTYSQNHSFLVSYTWSKTESMMDSLVAANFFPFIQPTRFNIKDFKGPAGFDVTHRLSASYTWNIPGKTENKLADAVVANWAFSGIASYDSGPPFFVVLESDNANIGSFGGRSTSLPNLVSDPILSNKTPQQWFNTSAYQIPPYGTQGNAGKHGIYSDGMTNFNLALSKRWPFKETRYFEFRAEAFNAFNQHSFGTPQFIIDAPAFGTINTVRQGGRQMQFALKLHF